MSLRQSSKKCVPGRLKLKICESQLQACGVAVQPFCIHTIQYSYHMMTSPSIFMSLKNECYKYISKEGIH
ncbi:hypothetical protein T07_3286 [Trichinella nelsoni]|uniref:Uncharacterized protein n=1 Tax=Trichinella nelsoni TaxID=6336 RepID=A0A0V0S504_9BILA|nr:hypothetical protein T07_3286 [Trichinella nelsoni]